MRLWAAAFCVLSALWVSPFSLLVSSPYQGPWGEEWGRTCVRLFCVALKGLGPCLDAEVYALSWSLGGLVALHLVCRHCHPIPPMHLWLDSVVPCTHSRRALGGEKYAFAILRAPP